MSDTPRLPKAIVIVVQLKGGLGNQLFQYAAARRLSLTMGVPLKLDIGFSRRQKQWAYELDRFCIEAGMASHLTRSLEVILCFDGCST